MNKFFWSLAAGVFLWASCGSDPGVRQEPLPVTGERTDDPASPDLNLSGPSLEEIHDSGYWITRPLDSSITIIGIAGRRSNRDDAITEALADAARKVSLYHGIHGESSTVLNQGPGSLDYVAEFNYSLEPLTEVDLYLEKLAFDKDRDVLEKNGAVYVRFRYSGVSGIPPYHSSLEDGVPNWVRNTVADIPGFLTGIGISKNKGSLQKTYQASYENAIVALLPRLFTRISGEIIDVEGGKMTRNVSTSEGDLTEVMILETWFDKKINAVWTLVAAKQKL
ncbi:MAG: dolichyl-diphosphooligosaccharide--protein glycosyltransferase subunit STT3 [Spirochaetaceae bacterium]|nr:dolichyl-diphosphooligosaccharide--protein glycosyltransferase subunit STT3 [Spirochaetaceae bacterium]